MADSRHAVCVTAMVSALMGALAFEITPVAAAVINGGFETGDFSGWTQTFSTGSQDVASLHVGVDRTTYDPVDGGQFAVLVAGAVNQPVTIEQSFALGIGDTVTGWAFFSSYEFENTGYNDFAFVQIFGSSSALVAQPFYSDSDTIGLADGPWTPWSLVAPTSDRYTLRMGVANGSEDQVPVEPDPFPSEAGFDDVRVAALPEPSSLLVLSLGLLASRVWYRRVKG